MTHVRDRARAETGTAMVEMALVLPVLLLIILGVVDFGRAVNYWNDTNQLAGEGARHAAVNRNPGTADGLTLQQYIQCRAENREVRGPGVVCDGDEVYEDPRADSDSVQTRLKVCITADEGVTVGSPITVRVETRYYVIPLIRDAIEDTFGEEGWGSIGLSGEATMRLEQTYTGPLGCEGGGVA